MAIKLFSLPCCPRCEMVKDYLKEKKVNYTPVDMDSAEGITELRVAGIFEMEAPVLMNDETDVFLSSSTMFPDGTIDKELINTMVGAK